MEEYNSLTKRQNRLQITDRKFCSVNGIIDVLAFDLHEILLETDQGMLMISGNNLHVNRLTVEKGEIDVEGQIDSIAYSDSNSNSYSEKGDSFFTKMFR